MSELNSKIKRLFPDRHIVAFYIRDCQVVPDEWMVALGQELRKLGYGVIGLLSKEATSRMNFDGLDQVFEVKSEEVAYLDSINCFIATDIERIAYPQTSRVLACTHGISCMTDPGSFTLGLYTLASFDGYLVGFPLEQRRQEITKLWNNFFPSEKSSRPASDFYLMGYGYAKLDLMRRKFQNRMRQASPPRSICYAPTLIGHAPHLGGQRVHLHGKRIIRTLLSCFPEHEIIFRPYPGDIDAPLVRDIVAAFADVPRFHLDTQPGYLDTFAATCALVTDTSHAATSFTLTTLRPSIYFQPWREVSDYKYSLSYTTTSYTGLVAAVREAIQAMPEYDRSKLYEHYGLLPAENAIETLARAIPDFIDARPHEDWLVIRREKGAPGIAPSRMIMTLLCESSNAQPGLATYYAQKLTSRPLAVFALHLLRQRTPDAPIPDDLAELAGIAPAEGERRYADIGTEELVRLYMAAAEDEKARSRQPEQIKMQDVTTLYELARLVVEDTPL